MQEWYPMFFYNICIVSCLASRISDSVGSLYSFNSNITNNLSLNILIDQRMSSTVRSFTNPRVSNHTHIISSIFTSGIEQCPKIQFLLPTTNDSKISLNNGFNCCFKGSTVIIVLLTS